MVENQNQEVADNEEFPDAEIRPSRRLSTVWIIPILAVFVGAWMLFYSWHTQGPLITISFKSAEGLEVDTTQLKLRDISVGKVVGLNLADDFKTIEVVARLSKESEPLLSQDTKFWIVKPRIGKSGVSGLNTLFSGGYIELSPGSSKKRATEFVGLENPPVTPIGKPGLHVTLSSDDQFAFSAGDPIVYKGLTVGRVEDVYFNFEKRVVYYNAFINAPYHQLVTMNTRFWSVGGISLDLKDDGLTLHVANLESLLSNSVTFAVPEGMPRGEAITERHEYRVYESYDAARAGRFRAEVHYVVLVSDSIRGLNVGASVEYRGLKIGEVMDTNIYVKQDNTILEDDIKIPVLIRLQPGLANLPDNEMGEELLRQQVDRWVQHGLKARLQTGNLLTGSLFVELQHYADSQGALEYFAGHTVIPTEGNALSQITAKASSFMDKLNDLPLDGLSKDTRQLLTELTITVRSLKASSDGFSELMTSSEQQQISTKLAGALSEISQLAKDFSKGSASYEALNQTLKALSASLHELKPLLQQVNNKPNSLIFSGAREEPLIPKKHQGAEE